jgi:hypothetical protein
MGTLDGTTPFGYGPSMLPTLGLTKYKEVDLQINQTNPYKVHDKTEKMLVLRERERLNHDLFKLQSDALNLHDKVKTSRPTRTGVIREIKNIRCSTASQSLDVSRKKQRKIQNEDTQKIKKHNIFKEADSGTMMHQRFNSIGYNDQTALMPY